MSKSKIVATLNIVGALSLTHHELVNLVCSLVYGLPQKWAKKHVGLTSEAHAAWHRIGDDDTYEHLREMPLALLQRLAAVPVMFSTASGMYDLYEAISDGERWSAPAETVASFYQALSDPKVVGWAQKLVAEINERENITDEERRQRACTELLRQLRNLGYVATATLLETAAAKSAKPGNVSK